MDRAYGVGDKQTGNTLFGRKYEIEDRGEAVSQGEVPPRPPIGEWEARVPKVAAIPYPQTKRKIEEHEATHLPHRPWCKHCVYGKGISSTHEHKREGEQLGITISIDYGFLSAADVEEGVPPILVVWNDSHEVTWALPVDAKGPLEYVV